MGDVITIGLDLAKSVLEPADEMEEELPARLREGQITELVQDHEVKSCEMVGEAALAGGPELPDAPSPGSSACHAVLRHGFRRMSWTDVRSESQRFSEAEAHGFDSA